MDFDNIISINLNVKDGILINSKKDDNKTSKNIPKITNDIWDDKDKEIYIHSTRKELGYINRTSDLGQLLNLLTSDNSNHTFLDIGTFNGYGSTRCMVEGLINRQDKNFVFFSLEPNPDKWRNSKALYYGLHNILILQEVINKKPQNDILNVFPVLRTDERERYLYQVDLNNIERSGDFINDRQTPHQFDVVLFNGGKYTDFHNFLTIKDRCKYVILLDMETNPSTKKILETINNENKNSKTWKKFYEYNGNGNDSYPFVIYYAF